MAASVNPLWSDGDATFPGSGAAPTGASILGCILAEIPDPLMDFQPESTLKAWFKQGQQQMALQALTNALARGGKGKLPRDHALIGSLLKVTSGLTTVASVLGYGDYPLPTDCYLLMDTFLYQGTVDEVMCAEVPFEWDYRVRTYPLQYGPASDRPLVAVRNDGRAVRLYLAGQIPAATLYGFRYLRIPAGTFLDPDDASAEKSDLPDPFNRGPISYTVARWMASRETDPEPYLVEARLALEASVPALAPAGAA